MAKFSIVGGNPLEGNFEVSGMKNAATPLISASMLLSQPVTLHRMPRIIDVERMLQLVESAGAKILWKGNSVTIDPRSITETNFQTDTVKKLRSSILLVGSFLARFGKVTVAQPGGCYIGNRSLDSHVHMFKQLGVETAYQEDGSIAFSKKTKPSATVILSEFSVGATENAILYAVFQKEPIRIVMAACEPHVQDLCNFLVRAGARIEGIGTHELIIFGNESLHLNEWTIIPDQIEIGTIAVAAACTRGSIDIHPIVHNHLYAFLQKFESIGIPYTVTDNHLVVRGAPAYKNFKLQTLPYPGFPTDLQAPMGILATQCDGMSLIHDPMFDGRFSYVQELVSMGAHAVVCDPHRVIITGKTPLRGARIKSFDLRAGATLIIAGLCAHGTTVIEDAEIVDRGYEQFDKRLQKLGAQITRS